MIDFSAKEIANQLRLNDQELSEYLKIFSLGSELDQEIEAFVKKETSDFITSGYFKAVDDFSDCSSDETSSDSENDVPDPDPVEVIEEYFDSDSN